MGVVMTTVTETVEVAVPARTAYNQWTQFEEFPDFMQAVDEVRQITDTRTHWVTSIGGVTREFDAEIVEQVPDQKVAWVSTSGIQQHGQVFVEPVAPDRTRVTVEMEYEPEGITEQAADTLGLLTRQVRSDLDRFREFIESRGTETGAWRGQVPEGQGAATGEGPIEQPGGMMGEGPAGGAGEMPGERPGPGW
jgi:uncharacterized membrane protein